MTINLPQELFEHYRRVKNLAEEAADDSDQGFQSRSAAMSTMTTILKDLVKSQESVIHMERLMKVEAVIIEICKECLTEEGLQAYLTKLEARLEAIE